VEDFKPIPRQQRDPSCLALAKVIRTLRERRGWTFTELAARSGVTRQMLCFLESNARNLGIETLDRIARAFGMPGSSLLQLAEQLAARWPDSCAKCNYSCVVRGELKWWNPGRGCARPAR
jgi:transcriptional regulator with XRE-family HTH domain